MSVLLAVLVVGCRSDEGLKVYNSEPTVVITSHDEGTVFTDSIPYIFEASVADGNHKNEELILRWSTDQRDICPEVLANPEGRASCETDLLPTESQIRLEVSDPEGATAVASLSFSVQETAAPEIEIVSPDLDGSYYSDIPILFSARISDAEDTASALSYQWTSNQDGDLEANSNPQQDGTIDNYVLLSDGIHNLSLYVEDTDGKNNTQTIPITVKAPNQSPECAITLPVDSQAYLLGQTIDFQGTATDHEDDNSSLSISWESSIDGSLGSSVPLNDGSIGFSSATLSAGYHSITLYVEDEVDALCSANINISVGTAPSISWLEPTDMFVNSLQTDLSFVATLIEDEDPVEEVLVEWSSDLDGVFSTTGANTFGEIEFDHANLQVGLHQITVSVTDLMGFGTVQTRSVLINTPPEAPSIQLEPSQPSTADDLISIVAAPSDADGDAVTLSYLWHKDGVPTAHSSAVISSSLTEAGEEWTLIITPNDGYTDGESAEATVSIENTGPAAADIDISRTSTYNDAILSCAASFIDPDEVLTPTYQWSIVGQNYSGSTLDLSTTNAMPEDVVTCTATAVDSFGQTASNTADVSIENRAPNPISVSITPSNPQAGQDDLSCTVSGDTDDDGQTVSLSYEWKQNGNVTSFGTSIIPTAQLVPYDNWTCTVTPTDGIAIGAASSASTMIDAPCLFGHCDESIYLSTDLGIDLVYVQAGSFLMGSPEQEEGHVSDEVQHSVLLSDNYYVATTEVTQAMFQELMGYDSRVLQSTTYGDGDDHPAYFVNWNMAASFSNVLTARYNAVLGTNLSQCYSCTGSNTSESCTPVLAEIYQCTGFRLLTEAEWEYAARASSDAAFWTPSGGGNLLPGYQGASFTLNDNSDLRDYAWYLPSVSSPWGAKEVATKQENGNNLFDMHGNIAEWVHDTYDVLPSSSQIDPVVFAGTSHILRGGAWDSAVQNIRVASRAQYDVAYRDFFTGFRIGRTDNEHKPTAPEISISPLYPTETIDDIICSIDSDSIDPNGAPISYTVTWLVDGIQYTGATATTVYVGDTILASQLQRDELWTCVITPSNGNMDGYAAQSTVTVESICTYSDCDSAVYLGNSIGLDFVELSGTDLVDPQGRYTIPSSFSIMTTEVSQGQFASVMGYDAHDILHTTRGVGDDYPAYGVNWHQAADFANHITTLVNQQHGSALSSCYSCTDSGSTSVQCTEIMSPDVCDGYTLPTEAEWELVSHSLSTANFWTGQGSNLGGNYNSNQCLSTVQIMDGHLNPYLTDFAWFCANANNQTQPIATKLPNAFGVYDMAGNVWEWTADWEGCTFPQTDGAYCGVAGSKRVRRGGAWTSHPSYLSSSSSANYNPDHRSTKIGFRLRKR